MIPARSAWLGGVACNAAVLAALLFGVERVGFKVGLGFRVLGVRYLGFRVWGRVLCCRADCSPVWGLRFGVWGLRFRV